MSPLQFKALNKHNITHNYEHQDGKCYQQFYKKLTYNVEIKKGSSITMWKMHTHAHTHTHIHTHLTIPALLTKADLHRSNCFEYGNPVWLPATKFSLPEWVAALTQISKRCIMIQLVRKEKTKECGLKQPYFNISFMAFTHWGTITHTQTM